MNEPFLANLLLYKNSIKHVCQGLWPSWQKILIPKFVKEVLVICNLFICNFAYMRSKNGLFSETYPLIKSLVLYMRICYMASLFLRPYLSHITRSTCIWLACSHRQYIGLKKILPASIPHLCFGFEIHCHQNICAKCLLKLKTSGIFASKHSTFVIYLR